jgi:hypothetical protein
MDTSVGDLGVGFQEGGQALGGDILGVQGSALGQGLGGDILGVAGSQLNQAPSAVGDILGVQGSALGQAGAAGVPDITGIRGGGANQDALFTSALLQQLGGAKGSSADLGENVGAQAIAAFLQSDIGNQMRQRLLGRGFQFGGKAPKGITSEDAFRRFLQEGGEPGAFRPVLSLANLGLKESDIEEVVRENLADTGALKGKATISLLQQMGIVPLQHGGTVPGPATPADSVPALLTGGELIVPTDIVNELRPSCAGRRAVRCLAS